MQGISTITPCHGRTNLVEKLLRSLEISRANFEGKSESILIDSSTSEDAKVIEELCKRYQAIYLRGPQSVRKKRNSGIEKAQYDVILFIDSDCEADPYLFNEHFNQYTQFPHICGVLGLTRFDGHKTWVWSTLKYTSLLDSFSFAEKYPYAMWGPTANLSLKKEIIEKAGYFKTNLPFNLGGDDLDLTLRITEHGFYIKCNPAAVVYHTTETWNRFRSLVERSWRWGRMEYYIYELHPQLRYNDFPKAGAQFLVWLVVGTSFTLIKARVLFLFLPVIWVVTYFIIDLLLWVTYNKYPLGRDTFLASILRCIYKVGSIVQFINKGNFQFLTRRVVFAAGQIMGEWDRQIIRVWSFTLAGFLMTFIFILFLLVG